MENYDSDGSSSNEMNNPSENNSSDFDSDSDDGGSDIMFLSTVFPRYFIPRIPRNTSRLQGADWMEELFNSVHPDRFLDALRMRLLTFRDLCNQLIRSGVVRETETGKVSAMESIAIFLRQVGYTSRTRDTQERFQHSNETINRHFRTVLDALCQMAPQMISPPDYNTVPDKIQHSPEFFPYFKDCVGAIDGTHVCANVSTSKQAVYRNRKGNITQNVLAICDFNMMFTYVYPGWEGSAHDSKVMRAAIRNDPAFPIPPEGKYYLIDSGYTNSSGFLAPHRNIRYHIPEWTTGHPRGPKELFNHRHSKLRNVIERSFGVLKERFPILKNKMPQFKIQRQMKIVIACCVIHNWIRKYDQDDKWFRDYEESTQVNTDGDEEPPHNPTNEEINAMSGFRNTMTAQIWADAQP